MSKSKKRYTVFHLYMGEFCCSDYQTQEQIVARLKHVREHQLRGWASKDRFLEALEKWLPTAKKGEHFLLSDLGAVVRR